ncbi:MAG: L,D-transpeptidase family protein [Burkholderiaceae bacterium]
MAAKNTLPLRLSAPQFPRTRRLLALAAMAVALSQTTGAQAALAECTDAGSLPGKAVLPWYGEDRLDARTPAALNLLLRAPTHGLRSEDYATTTLARRAYRLTRAEKVSKARADAFNRQLTASLDCFLGHLRFGSLNAAAMHGIFKAQTRTSMLERIRQAWSEGDISALETAVASSDPRYLALQRALDGSRALAASEAMIAADERTLSGSTLRPGEIDTRVSALRARLRFLGDHQPAVDLGEQLDDQTRNDQYFDSLLAASLQRFQARHGLEADGVLGPKTREELNTPIAARIAQIEMSMERLRWLPRGDNGPLVLVNLPEFRLQAGGNADTVDLESRVVVGRSGASQTPLFVGQVTRVELNPYWNVPHDIMLNEILPHMRRDAGYLVRKNMQVVRSRGRTTQQVNAAIIRELRSGKARLRQLPGDGNALGQVKFVLPNRRAIFLHDTARRDLFAEDRRDFSHGCVRVEKPIALTELMLANDPQWTPEKIDAALKSNRQTVIQPAQPVTVALTYLTASVGDDGRIRFHQDIYGLDAKVGTLVARWQRPGEEPDEAATRLARDWIQNLAKQTNAA